MARGPRDKPDDGGDHAAERLRQFEEARGWEEPGEHGPTAPEPDAKDLSPPADDQPVSKGVTSPSDKPKAKSRRKGGSKDARSKGQPH